MSRQRGVGKLAGAALLACIHVGCLESVDDPRPPPAPPPPDDAPGFEIGPLSPSSYPLDGGRGTVVVTLPVEPLRTPVVACARDCTPGAEGCPCLDGEFCFDAPEEPSGSAICVPKDRLGQWSLSIIGPGILDADECAPVDCIGASVRTFLAEPRAELTVDMPTALGEGAFDLILFERISDDDGVRFVERARAVDAGEYRARPAELTVPVTSSDVGFISPEMISPCDANDGGEGEGEGGGQPPLFPPTVTTFTITNTGETPMPVAVTPEQSDAFVVTTTCEDGAIARAASCSVRVCVLPSAPAGPIETRIEVAGAGASEELIVTAHILSRGSQLDPTFGVNGVVRRGAGAVRDAVAVDEGLFIASSDFGEAFIASTFDAPVASIAGGATAAAALPSGDVLLARDDNGGCSLRRVVRSGPVTSFGDGGAASLVNIACASAHRVAVAADRVFVSTPFQELAAFTLDGALDPGFADAGRLTGPTLAFGPTDLAADDTWLYVSDRGNDVTLRIARDGTFDPDFSLPHGGFLAVLGEVVFVAENAAIHAFSDLGELSHPLPGTVRDITVDAAGRVLVATTVGALRFDEAFTAFSPVGLAEVDTHGVACTVAGPCYIVSRGIIARVLP